MQKALRIFGVIAVVGVLIATIAISMTAKTPTAELVWDKDMTLGNLDAKNYYIIYGDLACPYCIYFENPIVENMDSFKDYLAEKDILVEIRLTDFLYEYGTHKSEASRTGAVAAYCAKDEGRFWDYYDLAVNAVYYNFFRNISGLEELDEAGTDFWLELGKTIGLGDSFKDCVKEQKPLATIMERAAKTSRLVDGMPYFKFNSYTFSGFDPNGTYEDVMMYMNAGLKSK